MFSYRLLQSIEQFEQKLIDSTLLSNTSEPAVILQSPNFFVIASLTCSTLNQSFPGQSISSSNNLTVNVASAGISLLLLFNESLIAGAIDLPENFAGITDKTLSSNETDGDNIPDAAKCSKPAAVIFHGFKNAKLFQSASAEKSNLNVQSDDILLGDELRAVNSMVLSASIIGDLNTSHLTTEMSFLLQERTPLVSCSCPALSNDFYEFLQMPNINNGKKLPCIDNSVGYSTTQNRSTPGRHLILFLHPFCRAESISAAMHTHPKETSACSNYKNSPHGKSHCLSADVL